MSTTIDERVVEMRFDNKHFESNVKETMSTLDKFKQKLNLTSASKGLENINTLADKVDMSGMSNAIQAVHSKFSALEIVGITALTNITNSAINAGKRIVKALTLDPVMDGFREYEMTLNAVQTTMAGTGKTAEEVEKELKKLDEYADKTVYSTSDMLNNLPKFTNAGVELEKATTAMIGIANATALAGGDAGKASIAFYNLGQAIGTGYLTRMDYNSINNAGIATMEWKNQMVEAAIAAGTLTKAGDNLYKSGNKTFTLQQLFIDGLQTQWATTDVMMKVFGDYGDETTEIGKKAQASAQDIKTFTQMMESLKATAGTGWKDTWQLIFGGLDEAKEFWTGLSNFISGVITGMADFRNKILGGALGKSFKGLKKSFSTITEPMKKTVDAVEKVTTALKDMDTMVNEVIRGNWGNGKARLDGLTKAGYNYYAIQNKVNEKLGCAFRYSEDLAGTQQDLTVAQEETVETTSDLIVQLTELSDAELKANGYTEEQVEALRELQKVAKKTGIPLKEFIDNIDEIDGRWLLINSFKNAGQGLVQIFTAIKDAWLEIFQPNSDGLFNIIAGLHKFSTILTVSDEAAKNLKNTLKGVFALFDIVLTIISGPIKIGLKIFGQLLKALDIGAYGILEFTGSVGEAIVAFHDWLESVLDFTPVFEAIAPYLKTAASAVRDWFNSLKEAEWIKKFTEYLNNAREAIANWFKELKENNIGENIIQGLMNGLKNGVKNVVEWFKNLGKQIIDAICKVLGIHSPSTEFFEIGENIIQGLINGIKNLAPSLTKLFSKIFGSIEKIEWTSIANLLTFFTTLIPGLSRLNIGAAFARLMSSIGVDSMDGLINGFKNCFGNVIDVIVELGKSILAGIKNVLGIHSPSTEFFKIGNNIIQGLINGLKNGFSAVGNTLKNFGAKCVEIFKKIDFGKVFAAGLGVGILLVAKSMIDAIKGVTNVADKFASATVNVTAPLKGIGDLLSGVGSSMKDFAKGYKASKQGEAIKNIAIAIALLAASVFVLSKIDPGTLWATIGAIAALTTIIGTLAFVMSKINTLGDSVKTVLSGGAIASIGIALLMLAGTMKILGSIESDRMGAAIKGLIAVVSALGILLVVFGKTVKGGDLKNIHQVGKMVQKVAWALLLLVGVIKLASMLEVGEIIKGIGVIAALGVMIAGLIAIAKVSEGDASKAGKMISKIAFALLITVGVIKLASMLDGSEIGKGIAVIAGVGLIFAGLVAVSKLAGANASKAGWMILQMSIALAITVGVVKLASMLDGDAIKRGLAVITTLGLLFTALIAVSHLAGANAIKAGTMILMVSSALLILTGVLFILSKMNPNDLYPALGVVAILEILIGGLIFVSKNAGDCSKSIFAMTAAIAVLVAAVIALTFIDSDKLLRASTSMGIMMGALALLIKSTKSMGDPKSVLTSLIPLIAVAATLGVLAVVLSEMDVNVSMETAKALSTLLLTMTGVLFILNKIGTVSYKGLGAIALLTLIVAGLAAIFGVMDHFNVGVSMESAKALSTLLLAMSGALVILGVVGTLGPAAFIGIGALATLIAGIGTIVVAIGALFDKFPVLEEFLDRGIPILEKIGYALGAFFGNIVGGFMSGVSNGLPELAMNLSLFMANLTPFLAGIKMVDGKVLSGIGILTGAILALTTAQLLSGITSLLTFGSSFADLGTELSMFMINAMPFIALSKQIDPSIMEGVKTLADAVLILTGANVLEGLTSWLTGGTSFENFGSQLVYLGEGLNNFITACGPLTDDQVSIAQNAANIIRTLAQVASEIPNTGGLLAGLVGDNDMSIWAMQLPVMAAGIVGFIKILNENGIEAEAVKTADTAAKIIKTLAQAASEIPNTGGLLASLIGDNDLSTFSTQLPNVGKGIVGFIKAMTEGEITEDKIKVASTAAEIVKTLAGAASEIPNTGGLLAGLIGDNDLSTFATQLPNVGRGIAGFANELGEFNDAKLSTVNTACKAIDSIVGLANINIQDTGSGLASFGNNMVKFAKKVKEFIEHIGEVGSDSITAAITKTKDLIAMASEIASMNIDSVKTFGESLKTIAKDGVKGFVKEFDGEEPKSKAKQAVESMLNSAIEGAEEKKEKVEEKFEDIADAAVDAMCTSTLLDDVKQAGKDLVTGFANGIKNNKYLAKDAGSAIGKAALEAAKEAIDSNSPSKEAEKLGNYFGQGLVIGIEDYESNAYNAGHSIADYAKNGLSRAISKVSDLMNSNMDSQPTIRPVLDLSDVESGIGYMSSMFNDGPSVGVMSNLRAISSGMNTQNQNGSNNDVVSAINKLRRDLGNVKGGDTYNVNGVTYDDGSNITDAVKTLVRAAKIERRV